MQVLSRFGLKVIVAFVIIIRRIWYTKDSWVVTMAIESTLSLSLDNNVRFHRHGWITTVTLPGLCKKNIQHWL